MSSYSEGQIHQLANRLEAEGFTSDEVTKLAQFKNLSDIRGLFRGTHELKPTRHIIDCDANPFCLNGWKVEEHRKGGQLKWSLDKIQLYLSEKQKNGGRIKGNELRKELEGKPVLNANVLDYLLVHTEIIPGEWEGKLVFFWGTIYRHPDGDLFVRYLRWDSRRWDWVCGYGWFDEGFRDSDPAALLAG